MKINYALTIAALALAAVSVGCSSRRQPVYYVYQPGMTAPQAPQATNAPCMPPAPPAGGPVQQPAQQAPQMQPGQTIIVQPPPEPKFKFLEFNFDLFSGCRDQGYQAPVMPAPVYVAPAAAPMVPMSAYAATAPVQVAAPAPVVVQAAMPAPYYGAAPYSQCAPVMVPACYEQPMIIQTRCAYGIGIGPLGHGYRHCR